MSTEELPTRPDQLELANNLFAWLQDSELPLPKVVAELTSGRLESLLGCGLDELSVVRDMVDKFEPTVTLPLRLYIAGFDIQVITDIDTDDNLRTGLGLLSESLRGIFPTASPVPAEKEQPDIVSPPAIETALQPDQPDPRKIAVQSVRKQAAARRPQPPARQPAASSMVASQRIEKALTTIDKLAANFAKYYYRLPTNKELADSLNIGVPIVEKYLENHPLSVEVPERPSES